MIRLLSLLLLVPTVALAQAPVIEISGANFRPMPLAVTAPQAGDDAARKAAAEFDAALMLDLSASGLFQVLDRKGFLADPKEGFTAGSIKFNQWSDVGAESLVKTQLMGEGDKLRGVLKLFSVGPGKQELELTEEGTIANPRRLAHQFADALWKHFTREPGPFLSRTAYVKKRGSDRQVWVADWDGKNAQVLAAEGLNLLPAVSPSGAVAFTSYRAGKPDIYVQEPGGKASVVVRQGQMATGIAYSPDGSRIAYSLAAGESAQIWVANADGKDAKKLTDTGFFINSSPSWSPDGKRIAFVSNRGGSPQIYVMNVDGSGVKRLTFRGNYNQTPDWSPRGDLIVFTARDERNAFDLFTVNVDNGDIKRLTQDQGNNEEPSFSPNGRLILFTSNRAGGSMPYVMNLDGSQQTALPVEKGTYQTPDWGK